MSAASWSRAAAPIHAQFLTAGLADELHLAIAPFFVGQPDAPRFVGPGTFSNDLHHRMTLAEVTRRRRRGSAAVPAQGPRVTGGPTPDDLRWLRRAIDLSRLSPPSPTAYNVGAILVDAAGAEIASGYSRDTDPHLHAEESALAKVAPGDPRLAVATMYSSLEPCTERHSRTPPCAELVIAAGIPRVVIAWREPGLFVADCLGVERLREAGITVLEAAELEPAARAVNAHLRGIVT